MIRHQSATFKVVAVVAMALAMGACSKKKVAGLNGSGLGNGDGNGGLMAGAGQVAPGSAEDFATNVGDRVFFLEDKHTLTAEAKDVLRGQVQWLAKYDDVTIQVEGHADERGTREYNLALSARRATAIRSFLISEGVSASRVSSIAYGKERPAALCDTAECWSQNRRGVTVITSGARTS